MGHVERKKTAQPLRGFIFDIKRFAVHDGPGIRTTVFLKGCPLHCLWCHNPESIDCGIELITRSSRCSRCFACLKICPKGAISKGQNGGPVVLDRAKCDLCGLCAEACMYEALEIVGRKASVADVLAEVEKDRIFYEQSGGGVTLSGGEPLAQPEFSLALLEACRAAGFHAALDTSGLASWETLGRVASAADLILYDLKVMDEAVHKKFTGVSNIQILKNLIDLAGTDKPIHVRIPLAAGVNDDEANVQATIDFLRPLPAVRRIDLLKYHKGGQEKYRNLGQELCFRIFAPPSEERMEEIRRSFTGAGFNVTIGG
jgi:pyruvate formate lyase activating enzyme